MKTEIFALAVFFGGLLIVGRLDHQSAEVTWESAMESPRPVFEPAHEVLPLSMPCTYIQQKRFDHEATSSRNTRCTKADRSE